MRYVHVLALEIFETSKSDFSIEPIHNYIVKNI